MAYVFIGSNPWEFTGGEVQGASNMTVGGVNMGAVNLTSAAFADKLLASGLTSIGVTFRHTFTTGGGTPAILELYDTTFSTSQPAYRIISSSGNWGSTTFKLEAWNGSSYDTLATSANNALATGTRLYTLWLVIDNSAGVIHIGQDGIEEVNLTGQDTLRAAITSINLVRLKGTGFSGTGVVGCVGICDHDPFFEEVIQMPLAGAGASSQWSGTYLNIDDAALDKGDVIGSSAAGDISLFSTSFSPSYLSGYTVTAVAYHAFSRRGNTAPTQFNFAERHSSTNYFSANQVSIPSWGLFSLIQTINPHTSAAYTTSELDSMELGVRSQA